MTTKDEALKCLKATTDAFAPNEAIQLDKDTWGKLHAAIKAVLAQPEQEPVGLKAYAWVYVNKYGVDSVPASKEWCEVMVSGHGGSMFPLYTTPQPAPAQELCSNCALDGRCMKRQAMCHMTGKQPAPAAQRVVIFTTYNPLYLLRVRRFENGTIRSGHVVNGGWNFEIRNGECLAKAGNYIVNRWPCPSDLEEVAIPDNVQGDYNDLIIWAQRQYRQGNTL